MGMLGECMYPRMLQAEETGDPGLQQASVTPCVHLGSRLGPTCPEVWRPLGPQRPWCTQLSLPEASLVAVPPPNRMSPSPGPMGWCPCALALAWEPLLSLNTLETEAAHIGGAAWEGWRVKTPELM